MIKASIIAKLVVAFFALLGCGSGVAHAQETPDVAARAWALTDISSGEVLAGENTGARLPMASTTKIMVALVAIREADLDEEATVSEEAAAFASPAYSNVGLLPGDTLSVRELLIATMVVSGDDAAHALAEHLGEGSARRFVEEMNREAEAMGLEDTRFENPVGLDAGGQYSSASDLATMTRLAMGYPEFREMVATDYATITTRDREIELVSTNDLLFTYPPATGVKTGTTPAAGSSLVASAEAEDESYVSVILDAREDRFAASIRTLEHAFAAYDRAKLVAKGEQYAEAGVPYRRGETVALVAKENVDGLVGGNPDVGREVRVGEELPGSAMAGTELGEVVVTVDGERVGQSALVARRGYKEASLWARVWYTASNLWS